MLKPNRALHVGATAARPVTAAQSLSPALFFGIFAMAVAPAHWNQSPKVPRVSAL